MKKVFEFLKKDSKRMYDLKNKKMKSLKNEKQESYENAKFCYICREKFDDKYA